MSNKTDRQKSEDSALNENQPKQVVSKEQKTKRASAEKKQKKQKKVRKEKRLVKKLKETGSELKKITWPTFPKVVKKTSVVIAVVVIFTIILFGVDRLLSFLFGLITAG